MLKEKDDLSGGEDMALEGRAKEVEITALAEEEFPVRWRERM